MLIRKAALEDAQAIAEASREIAKEPGFFCSAPDELPDEKFRHTLSTLQGVYLVAEQEGRLVGHAFLMLLEPKSVSHVAQLTIAVHKGFQEKGVGTKLLEKLIEWARENKVEKIELNVRATNARAIALYKKMGFHEEGRLKKRVKTGERYIDDLLMALPVQGEWPLRQVSRTGVYGLAHAGDKVLVVVQERGPYAGKFDLPGGRIEFGESVEEALRREFLEEVGMEFDRMALLDNFTTQLEFPGWAFHQIGLIYEVSGLRQTQPAGMKNHWVEKSSLSRDAVSPFLWKALTR